MCDAPQSGQELEGPEEVDYLTPTQNNLKPGSYLVNVKEGYRKMANNKYVCSFSPRGKLLIMMITQCEKVVKTRVTGFRHSVEHDTTFYLGDKDEFVIRQKIYVGCFPGTVSVF